MIKKEELKGIYDEFILSKKCELVKDRTIKDYMSHFRYFGEYLKTRDSGDTITEMDFRYYPLWMRDDKKFKAATINIRLSSLKCFLKWLYTVGHVKKDISSSVKKVKEDSGKVKSLSLAEQEKFIKKCRVDKSDESITKRTKYFLMLIYYTGMRPNEVVNLKIEDIDFRGQFINVNGETCKTGVTRKIATWDHNLESLLNDIITFNNSFDFITKNLFFKVDSGDEVDYSTIRHNINDYKKKWGLKNLTAYRLRHTYAMNTQSIGIGNLKQTMGHKSLRSTEKYLNSSPEIVKNSFDNSKNNIVRLDYANPAIDGNLYKRIVEVASEFRVPIKSKKIKPYKVSPI